MTSIASLRRLQRCMVAWMACVLSSSCVDSAGPHTPRMGSVSFREGGHRAASFDDGLRAVQRLDALPQPASRDPAVRYARAVAAAHEGQRERALELLHGLAGRLPGLRREIAALEAECQLEVGPFRAAAEYYASQPSCRSWLQSARAWHRAGDSSRALGELSRVLASRKASRRLVVQARSLRAEIAERAGRLALAREDYRWLAVDAASPAADEAYERLAQAQLSKLERLRRAEALAERGLAESVTVELERIKGAPGRSPTRAAIERCLATSYYRSRRNYGKAAQLFEQVARLARGGQVSDWFHAAEAWSRERNVGRAARAYREIIRRHSGPDAERARYLLARLNYRHGLWDEAERAYTSYLLRYTRPESKWKARFAQASRYERALSRLAGGHAEAGLQDIIELRRQGAGGYSRSLLLHLEGVALASSASTARQRMAVGRFEQVIREYPFSFAALASSARLAQFGKAAPEWKRPQEAVVRSEMSLELPEKVRLLADIGLYSEAERSLHAQEPVLFRQYSPRAGEALCRQYESLDRGFRRYELARAVIRSGTLRRLPTASNLWAWQCLHPRPFAATVLDLESRHGLPGGLIHAVMRQESAFRPDARSPAGAIGLMQLMPGTAEHASRELGLPFRPERLERPSYNLELGAFYLGKLLDSLDRRVVLALASYNAGPHAVSRWLEGSGNLSLDLWVARIPYRETRRYVQSVMSNWARYRYLAEGPRAVPRLSLQVPRLAALPASAY